MFTFISSIVIYIYVIRFLNTLYFMIYHVDSMLLYFSHKCIKKAVNKIYIYLSLSDYLDSPAQAGPYTGHDLRGRCVPRRTAARR